MASLAALPAPPSHKLIPGCGFLIDGFRFASHPAAKAFFLSHAHSDHYAGLREDWSRGPIYCSKVTARLIAHMLGVGRQWLVPLPPDTQTMIQGVLVTLVSANHCPGAVQFLFALPDGRRFVHTGDMRYRPTLLANPHLQRFKGCDVLFLDTTYCNPKYCFPPQEESIEYIVGTMQQLLQEDVQQPGSDSDEGQPPGQPTQRQYPFRRLYLIATYGIGKERILTALHDRCGVRLHVANRKHAVMQQLDMPGYDPGQIFTTNRSATPVHVVQWGFLGETWPFFRPNFVNLEQLRQELGAKEVVGFVPTGWLYEMRKETFSVRRKGACSVHLVPYSEHSSYAELLEYVCFLRPHQVVPTVGVDGKDAERARAKMLKHFHLLVDEMASKVKFLAAMHRTSSMEGSGSRQQDGNGAAASKQAQQDDCFEGEEQQQEAQADGQGKQDFEIIDLADEEEGEEKAGRGEVAAAQEGASTGAATATAVAGTTAAAGEPPAMAHRHPEAAGEEAAGPTEPLLQQLLELLGEEASKQQGRQLLVAANGNLQAAVNGYYDGQAAAAAAGGRSSASQAAPSAALPAVPSSAAGRPGGGSGVTAGSKRAAPMPTAKGKGKAGSAKKPKGMAAVAASPGQKAITAFFAWQQQQEQEQERQPGGLLASTAVSPAAAAVSDQRVAGEDLAHTFNVPLAGGTGAAPAGGKPELVLPPPPSPSTAASTRAGSGSGGFFLSKGGGGSSARAAAVPRDVVALPLEKYDPIAQACWDPGEPTPYLHLARAFDAMHGTKKRLCISDVLVNCFRSVLALRPVGELVQAAYLATGQIAPSYEGVELKVGGAIMSSAIVEATGVCKGRLRDMYRDMGDVGDVFQACKQNQAVLQCPAPLTVPSVFAALQQIALEKGNGSQKRRQRTVLSLLRACRETEPKFMARTLVQNLRVGTSWRSVIPSLAKAIVLHKEGPRAPKAHLEEAAAAATAAFHICPNLQLLIDAMLAHPTGEWQQRCPLTPGMPIKPMLAKVCKGLDDALEQLKGAPFLAEWKYDGMRAQIHLLHGGRVRIFSRNCEDQSGRFPDAMLQIVEAAQGGAVSAIIDAELVAVDRSNGNRLRAFQELATRKKVDVKLEKVSVHICIFAFDLLYRDGTSLVHLPLEQRRQQLLQALPNMQPSHCALAQSVRFPGAAVGVAPAAAAAFGPGSQHEAAGSSAGCGVGKSLMEGAQPLGVSKTNEEQTPEAAQLEEQLQECLLSAFAAGAEGLMLKSLATAYEPSKRSDHWIKVKRDYCEGLHDTLDLVVIGAWYGNGRKAGWFSPYLLACYDPDTEELQSVCRCMSGFSDAFYRESKLRLEQTVIPGPKPYYNTGERPDVWFEPQEVWEIRGADLSLSPLHKAAQGRVHAERGLGLRFPRFLGRVREDKGPEDATSAEQIAAMFHAQTRKVETVGQRLAAGKQQLQSQQDVVIDEKEEADGGSTDLEVDQHQRVKWMLQDE